MDPTRWHTAHTYPQTERYDDDILAIVSEVRARADWSADAMYAILQRYRRENGAPFHKAFVVQTYRRLCAEGRLPFEQETLRRLQLKPLRTLSGVAPVTVLTKPYPCPGKCIFCPTDARMPKSYLHDEPGAMRAEQNEFDPFRQTANRLRAFETAGHSTAKVELLILGGTWSAYPRDYQTWFIQRCLDAMNARASVSLTQAQRWNETARHRNVGLVIETRPDHIDPDEIRHLRRLGVTKVQLGAQSLDDRVLQLNQRGHTVEATRRAVTLLRAAGFKIALHWMPNLLGATPESDREDFRRLWEDPALRPDELKIYPCSLLANAELYAFWLRGEYHPYPDDELLELIVDCKQHIPRYCRVNRVIRDIPSSNIVAGSKRSNLRQDVQREMHGRGRQCQCIRCREVRGQPVSAETLQMEVLNYEGPASDECFLSLVTREERMAGFLRLSLPDERSPNVGLEEIRGAAMIRAVHVYGPALDLGAESEGEAQHRGLGGQLIQAAESLSRARGYRRMAVIAAIGTREYYRQRGFEAGESYMLKSL